MAQWERDEVAFAPVAAVLRVDLPTLLASRKSSKFLQITWVNPTSCSTPLPSSRAVKSFPSSSKSCSFCPLISYMESVTDVFSFGSNSTKSCT
eukprot:CAMPEP_0171881050 /NCGR_PEP_ID=MMETSP0992-20121227/38785_1 /TAXON_ID=483369 /ORGANISM="non described non described, Strain CCMP2098" /LENGTH=92 /DNA_ID=CAMNT_0012506865 /DNA_START=22 /DNA_END=297 /DNA_ORIENTATION=-